MGDKTSIEWTDATWNPITGCSVVSPGCTNCYAMKLAGTRLRNHPSRAGLTQDTKTGAVWNGQVRFNEQWADAPLRWRRPRMIFVNAHGDLFHESVTDEQIDRVFAIMAIADWHTYQVLTKRADRMREYLSRRTVEIKADLFRSTMARALVRASADAGHLLPGNAVLLLLDNDASWRANPASIRRTPSWPLRHVWLGVSVEDQRRADERIPHLLRTPAAVRWLSCEPLLGHVDIAWALSHPIEIAAGFLARGHFSPGLETLRRLDWVVAGGESGAGARPMQPDWARSLRDQCEATGTAFFFKQWGAYEWTDGEPRRVGKHNAGRVLDGVVHSEMPR